MVNTFAENFPIFVQVFFPCCANKDAFILTQAGAIVWRRYELHSTVFLLSYTRNIEGYEWVLH